MDNEKCFCHLNGYQVKDAVARQNIETLNENLTNLSSEVDTKIEKINEELPTVFEKNGLIILNGSFQRNQSSTLTNEKYIEIGNKILDYMTNNTTPIVLLQGSQWGIPLILDYYNSYLISSATDKYLQFVGLYDNGQGKTTQMRLHFTGSVNMNDFGNCVCNKIALSVVDLPYLPSNDNNVLKKNNTSSYNVTSTYQPAHKKYVDESILAKTGDLTTLTTTDKTNLVNAINELKNSSGGGTSIELEDLTSNIVLNSELSFMEVEGIVNKYHLYRFGRVYFLTIDVWYNGIVDGSNILMTIPSEYISNVGGVSGVLSNIPGHAIVLNSNGQIGITTETQPVFGSLMWIN